MCFSVRRTPQNITSIYNTASSAKSMGGESLIGKNKRLPLLVNCTFVQSSILFHSNYQSFASPGVSETVALPNNSAGTEAPVTTSAVWEAVLWALLKLQKCPDRLLAPTSIKLYFWGQRSL